MAEPDVRPPDAANLSAKWIYLVEIPLAAMAAGEWLRKEPLGTGPMDLRQLTVYEQFGWINMRAVTFSFVDQISSRSLKKFGENIPTSPISPEVIDVHTLNFKPNFKFSRLIFFWGGIPVPIGVCAT